MQARIHLTMHKFVAINTQININFIFFRILVLSEGRVVEFDSPDRLLKDTSSSFYQLATQAEAVETSQS